MAKFRLAFLVFNCAAALFLQTVFAQTAAKKCVPVTPKNPQEALMLEQTSKKKGCWTRDKKTGQLVFVSDSPPSQNYNPEITAPKSSGCKPVLRPPGASATQAALPMADLSGQWKFTTGVYPGEGELALARAVGSPGSIKIMNNCEVPDTDTYNVTIQHLPSGKYCLTGSNGFCLTSVGPRSFTHEDDLLSCKYELDGAILRGACFDKAVVGRVELTVASR